MNHCILRSYLSVFTNSVWSVNEESEKILFHALFIFMIDLILFYYSLWFRANSKSTQVGLKTRNCYWSLSVWHSFIRVKFLKMIKTYEQIILLTSEYFLRSLPLIILIIWWKNYFLFFNNINVQLTINSKSKKTREQIFKAIQISFQHMKRGKKILDTRMELENLHLSIIH